MNPTDTPHAPTRLKRLWQTLRRPSSTYSLLVLLAAGFVAGILFWGGFHTVCGGDQHGEVLYWLPRNAR